MSHSNWEAQRGEGNNLRWNKVFLEQESVVCCWTKGHKFCWFFFSIFFFFFHPPRLHRRKTSEVFEFARRGLRFGLRNVLCNLTICCALQCTEAARSAGALSGLAEEERGSQCEIECGTIAGACDQKLAILRLVC